MVAAETERGTWTLVLWVAGVSCVPEATVYAKLDPQTLTATAAQLIRCFLDITGTDFRS